MEPSAESTHGTRHQAIASAPSTTLAFTLDRLEWPYFPYPGVERYHIWNADDSWAENFPGTSLGSANQMTLTLVNDGNSLQTSTINADVLLNSVRVGSVSFNPNSLGTAVYNFNFPTISGPDYRLEIRATNTVTDGCVSISMDGTSFAVIRTI